MVNKKGTPATMQEFLFTGAGPVPVTPSVRKC